MDTPVMSSTPKVSIITPFFNIGPLLKETVASVLQQYYQNWELWLIDDGSTDSSTGIAKGYADQYPGKIFYLEHESHKNMGAPASRNKGAEHSTGELIAILDSDDVWLPDFLVEQVKLIEQHAAAMVCEASEYWYDWNDQEGQNEIIAVGGRQDFLHRPPQLMLDLYPLADGAAPCPCGILVRKDAWVKHGGFDTHFKGMMYDDQAFLVKVYLHEPVYISSGCHNKYRQRPGSLVFSSYQNGNYHQQRKVFLIWLEQYLNEKNILHPQINDLLRRNLFPYYHPIQNALLHQYPDKAAGFLKRILRKATATLH